jgi:hypothetical protein
MREENKATVGRASPKAPRPPMGDTACRSIEVRLPTR